MSVLSFKSVMAPGVIRNALTTVVPVRRERIRASKPRPFLKMSRGEPQRRISGCPKIATHKVREQESYGLVALIICGILDQADRFASGPARTVEVPLPGSKVIGLQTGEIAVGWLPS